MSEELSIFIQNLKTKISYDRRFSYKCAPFARMEVMTSADVSLFGCLDTHYNDTQHNDTHYNDTQHNNTQHNDTQHNATQHNDNQQITFCM
jgi:hypothetical protein